MLTITDDTPVRARKLLIAENKLHYILLIGAEGTEITGSIDKPQGTVLNEAGRAWIQLRGFVMLGFNAATGTPNPGYEGSVPFRALPALAKQIITDRVGKVSA